MGRTLLRTTKSAVGKTLSRLNLVRQTRDCVRWYRHWGTMPVRSWVRAADCFRKEEFARAAVYYRMGLASKPRHPAAPSARFDLAYCLYRTSDVQAALSELDELVALRTPLKEVYLLRARIQLALGRPISAGETMHMCMELFPEDLQVLSCYTHTCILSRADGDEFEILKRRLYLAKSKLTLEDERNVHLDTAVAHFEIRFGDALKGERILARVLATGAAPFEAVLLKGERLLEQGRVLPAREQLTRAMTAAKRDPRPVLLLARSYLRTGGELNPTWALQLAQAACKLSSWQNAEALAVLAKAYEACEEHGHAQLFSERIKHLESNKELNMSYFQSSLQQLRSQKISNT